MKNIVSFSGGKDSTAMLLKMVDEGMQIDEIIYCDTGMEFDAMYEHILQVENFIDREITVVKADYEFTDYLFNKTNEKSNGFPRFRTNRWCTSRLKEIPFNKYIKFKYGKQEVVRYIGIASDEVCRCKDRADYKYPLVEWDMTEHQALEYCYSMGFRWDGLYEIFNRVSCWCCPLQPLGELKKLYLHFPDKWKIIKEWEKDIANSFRTDYAMKELELRFDIAYEVESILSSYNLDCRDKVKETLARDIKQIIKSA